MSINRTYTQSEDMEGNENTPLLHSGSAVSRVKGSSFASAVFNLMNAIMGSGILGLAYAMANTGIATFCILLVLVSSLAAYSIHLLLTLCDQTGINSYEGLGEKALKKPGKVLVGISIIVQNIGGSVCSQTHVLVSVHPEVGASCSHRQSAGPGQDRTRLVRGRTPAAHPGHCVCGAAAVSAAQNRLPGLHQQHRIPLHALLCGCGGDQEVLHPLPPASQHHPAGANLPGIK